MSHGKLRSDDFEALARNLVTFITSGLCALCAPQRPTVARSAGRR